MYKILNFKGRELKFQFAVLNLINGKVSFDFQTPELVSQLAKFNCLSRTADY